MEMIVNVQLEVSRKMVKIFEEEYEEAKFLIGKPTIENIIGSDNRKKTIANLKFKIPMETDGCGRNICPTSTIGQYIDSFVRDHYWKRNLYLSNGKELVSEYHDLFNQTMEREIALHKEIDRYYQNAYKYKPNKA